MTSQVSEKRHNTAISDGIQTPSQSVASYEVTPSAYPIIHERIRWDAILAGLFAALTALGVLSVLGLAIGLSRYDAGAPLRNFGIGAGIGGIITTILAFLIGGWLAARTAGARDRAGIGYGAMVWVVAIPLIFYLLGSGLGALVNTAGRIVADQPPGTQVTVQTADQNGANTTQATTAGEQVTSQNVEAVTSAARKTAWGTLAALLTGLVASAFGGLIGARPVRDETFHATT